MNSVINFLIVAFAAFLLVKGMNNLQTKAEEAPPAAPTDRECPFCVSTISLKAKRCPHCTSQVA